MQPVFFRTLSLAVLFCLFVTLTQAQRKPMRYGRVDKSELSMTRCEADTTAKAVILGDYGVTELRYSSHRGWHYSYIRHMRVKIFDKDAFDLADYKIYLHSSSSDRERLTSLRANVWTPENGKMEKTKMRRNDSFTEEISDYLSSVNFTLPNIQEGSLFEVQYTIESPFMFTLPTWAFQNKYPTVFSEFRTYIPEYFLYKPLMQGFLTLTDRSVNNRDEEVITIYRLENAPAFKTEPHMNAAINYISKIEHELVNFTSPYGAYQDFSTTWPQLTKMLMESRSFGKLLERSNFFSEEVEMIMAENSEPMDRMIAAYELIQGQMTWNRSNSIYAKGNLRKSWDDKEGNVADINLMLVFMLRELGLEADPVILSTRGNGIINPAQIMINKYNYVVAHTKVGDKSYLLDATQKHTPYYLLPERALNEKGRLICLTKSKWVDLEAFNDNLTHTQSNVKVLPSGSIEARLQRETTNYNRLGLESRYRSYDRVEDFMDKFESDHQGIDLVDFELENFGDWTQPLISNYEFEIPELDNSPKDIIYVNPLLVDRSETNPFRIEKREFPVDFIYPFKRIYDITIEIPEGYTVDEMPRNTRFVIPRRAGSYQTTYELNGDNTIQVHVEMEIGKSVFLPTEYKDLRNFYARIVEEQARNIVLKKL